MTLTRLVLAWLPVAVWFLAATAGAARVLSHARLSARLLKWRVAEALVVTLIASLWFDSLGRGEWWLPFLLIGVLAAVSAQLADGVSAPQLGSPAWLAIGADVVRYVVAGGILAWRLG